MSHAHTLFESIILCQSLRGGKGTSQKFHSPFKACSDTQQANKLLTKKSLKEGSNPWFLSSLRDIKGNSIIDTATLGSHEMEHTQFLYICAKSQTFV